MADHSRFKRHKIIILHQLWNMSTARDVPGLGTDGKCCQLWWIANKIENDESELSSI